MLREAVQRDVPCLGTNVGVRGSRRGAAAGGQLPGPSAAGAERPSGCVQGRRPRSSKESGRGLSPSQWSSHALCCQSLAPCQLAKAKHSFLSLFPCRQWRVDGDPRVPKCSHTTLSTPFTVTERSEGSAVLQYNHCPHRHCEAVGPRG